jgi:hypothetical protein
MKRFLLILGVLLIAAITMQGQFAKDFIEKSEVHGSFQFDGAYYMPDEALGITDSTINGQNFGFNGFGNITYTLGNFSAGFRYEAYLPPLAGFDPRLEGQGIPYIWATYAHENFSVTVGSFYEQFGYGLTLRAYQEWMLGYDNAINGARVTYEPVKGFMIKGIWGVQRFFWDSWEPNGRGIVKGIDGEVDFNQVVKKMQSSKFRLSIGGSAVSKYQDNNNPKYNLPYNVSNIGGRINMGYSGFNLNAEYAWKVNDPSAINRYIYKDGEALMLSLTYSTKGFGFFGMFKRYDNMSYRSNRAVTANALDINFLPPNTETHTYMLTAMYPYATQPNGEIGFQFQVNYKIPKKSKLGGKYGMGIALNYSQVNNIVRKAVSINDTVGELTWESGTLGWESPFFAFGDPVFWQDFNVQIDKKFNKKLKGIFTYMNQTYDYAVLQGHLPEGQTDSTVYANIAVIDMTYKFNSNHALKLELQGLWTQQDNGNWAAFLLEYTISPNWFFAVYDQYNYGNPIAEEQIHYWNGSFGYTHRTTRISVAYGRQREGVVCVGGVCRVVPPSNGFTFSVSTNF